MTSSCRLCIIQSIKTRKMKLRNRKQMIPDMPLKSFLLGISCFVDEKLTRWIHNLNICILLQTSLDVKNDNTYGVMYLLWLQLCILIYSFLPNTRRGMLINFFGNFPATTLLFHTIRLLIINKVFIQYV